MDTEIAVEWMGLVLKALVQWFKPPKDLSDLPDAPPQYTFTTGANNVAFGYNALNVVVARPIQTPLYDYATVLPVNPNVGQIFFHTGDNTLRITTGDTDMNQTVVLAYNATQTTQEE